MKKVEVMKEQQKLITKQLYIYASLIPIIMCITFAILSSVLGKTLGYVIPYVIYLSILLFGTVYFHRLKDKANLEERKKDKADINTNKKDNTNRIGCKKDYKEIPSCKYRYLYYLLAFIPVLATFAVAFLPTVPHISLKLFAILIVYAICNGTLEEMFWRYTFNQTFGNDMVRAYVIPTIIFTCWHFALLFAKGVSYNGGALALVGGACMMGAIWGLTMYKTKNVKVVIGAHVLVNFFAFSQLLYENWFL